jgi:hypothetical protein
MPKIELIFFRLDQPIDWAIYSTKPTACLLIADIAISEASLASIVRGAAKAGCTFFMSWGATADELHDRIDEILEDGSDDWLRILTTSHRGKTAEDVSAFLFTATLPGRPEARYLVIGDKPVEELQRVITVPEE